MDVQIVNSIYDGLTGEFIRFAADTWNTIELIRTEKLHPSSTGRYSTYVFQYVRDTSKAKLPIKFSKGTFAIIYGKMPDRDRVIYYKVKLCSRE